MQKCFGLVRCICRYRYVIGVVGVGYGCCGVPSASFLRQFEKKNGKKKNLNIYSDIFIYGMLNFKQIQLYGVVKHLFI